jgi:hypothetical protein
LKIENQVGYCTNERSMMCNQYNAVEFTAVKPKPAAYV